MAISRIRFNKEQGSNFHKELNIRVNAYFKENELCKKANFNMKFKTVFMVGLYFIPLFLILTNIPSNLLSVVLCYIVMGFGMSGIGLAIMHDANHGAYSNNKNVNRALGYLINFIGGYHVTWIIQHNVLHHSFTNIHGHDEDLDQNVMRFTPDQKWKSIFKYQAYYATFFYGLLSIYRYIVKDLQQLLRYNKMELLTQQGLSFKLTLIELITTKSLYLVFTLLLPIVILNVAWYHVFIAFFIMHFIAGLILALIFQPAHILEETDFYTPEPDGSVENNWAIHEMKTTSNFANGSRWFTWLIGGLNFQVEHHLFPHVCHVHYKNISPIVKQTAADFDVPYHQHTTFYRALKSHYKMLNMLGTGEYDRMRAAKATAPVVAH